MKEQDILNQFNHLFWFLNGNELDPRENAGYIIHQVLSLGTLEDINKLIEFYGKQKVKKEFAKPGGIKYEPAILTLISLLLDQDIPNKELYIKKSYADPQRNIR